jgi:sterol desaturase/sphingolipid hydroxylase (fatty acid hydroxylase superfamily)
MTEPTVLAIPFFLASLAIEAFVLQREGRGYDPADAMASISGGLGSLVTMALMKGAALAVFGIIYEHRILTAGTGVLAWVALTFAYDFCFYWYHRASHETRLLWAAHVVHHSSQRYTLATALRQSWTAPAFEMVFWAPLPFFGFRPEMVLLMSSFSLLYQYWIHTEKIGRLGPLEWFMNTPSHHRVHHASNPRYIDRNHAGVFIIWDKLFGTFEPETETVRYGLTKNVETHNWMTIQFHEFAQIAREVRASGSLRAALRVLTYMPPRPMPTKPDEAALVPASS